jgi:hypothetical protein
MAQKTPTSRASALRAPFWAWGRTQWWRTFLLGVWGEADVEIPAYILSGAAEGAHALLPACAPNVAPQKLTRFCTLAGPQSSSTWTQTLIPAAMNIYSLRDLLIPSGLMCMQGRGEDRGRSPGDSRHSGVHGAEGRERAKIASGVAMSYIYRCLMFGSCLLYVW